MNRWSEGEGEKEGGERGSEHTSLVSRTLIYVPTNISYNRLDSSQQFLSEEVLVHSTGCVLHNGVYHNQQVDR